jgi:thioredoxin
MKTIPELNDENFDQNIAAASLPVVVDVYAPWCGPCKMIAPILEQLAEHYTRKIRFFKVNVEEAPKIASRYEISGVPTLLLICQGEVREAIVGFPSPHELLAKLEVLVRMSRATAATEARL